MTLLRKNAETVKRTVVGVCMVQQQLSAACDISIPVGGPAEMEDVLVLKQIPANGRGTAVEDGLSVKVTATMGDQNNACRSRFMPQPQLLGSFGERANRKYSLSLSVSLSLSL